MPPVNVLFLGTGDAFCARGRHQAAYLVRADRAAFLLDCGATALSALKREGVNPGDIDAVLVSHLHGDHFAGLPFLFLEYTYLEPRRRPLVLAGPPGTDRAVLDLYRAAFRDAADNPLPFELRFIELIPGKNVQVGVLEILPFRVPHQEEEISLGFKLRLCERQILYSGDTGWTEDLVKHSEGTDLFICECSLYGTQLESHLDYARLAENRARFKTSRLILTHLGEEVLAHESQIDIELARDGLRIEF